MKNVVVRARKDSQGQLETLDSLLRRFKKACLKANILKDYNKHTVFLKKSLKRQLKAKEARIARSKKA